MEQELITKAKKLLRENGKIKFVTKENKKIAVRVFITKDDDLCEFKKGSYKQGYKLNIYSYPDVIDVVPYVSKVTPEQRWEKSIDKAIRLLEQSGLWTDLLQNLYTAKAIGNEKIKTAYQKSWEEFKDLTYEEQNQMRTSIIKRIDRRLIKKDEKGKEQINTEILWYMHSELKIKKMYFGKGYNEYNLKQISEGLKNRKETKVSGVASYDVSFEYNPKYNKAWYSEEFRGCGNGHYYLALNETHAMFYEDD